MKDTNRLLSLPRHRYKNQTVHYLILETHIYNETDLESAVAAGILSHTDVEAFRAHVAMLSATPTADEESFRLLSGFNDIFVFIAGLLLLVAVAWIGGSAHQIVGSSAVILSAWGLAEYFTRIRRMALPSILFLAAYSSGIFFSAFIILRGDHFLKDLLSGNDLNYDGTTTSLFLALSSVIAGLGTWMHWRRFHVPITIAFGAGAVIGVVIFLLTAVFPNTLLYLLPMTLALGIGVFALAMHWDMSDPQRITRRADVAFWLHLLAAPLIAHPVFAMLGLLDGGSSVVKALIVLMLYAMMGLVALAIDRRALLVSSLAYVLYAIGILFKEFGAVSLNIALTGLVIGTTLLLLAAFWQKVRAWIVRPLPTALVAHLPPLIKQKTKMTHT